jgi:hypothetical protein
MLIEQNAGIQGHFVTKHGPFCTTAGPSTAIGAQNAPISAQDDSLFFAQDDNSHVIDPLGPDQSMSKI